MHHRDVDQLHAAHHFLSGCQKAGLRRVVLSPGSRSGPLAIAMTQVAELEWSLHLDERSAAFAALGEAKVTGEPVGLICTSGTAAANYLPAVAEAAESGVPLVLITSDRPPEHISWGVGQAFVQAGLYGVQVRQQIQMPVGGDGGVEHAIRTGTRATITAREERGPVHVNWPFRLPLEPSGGPMPPIPEITLRGASPRGTAADVESIEALVELVRSATRGVIVAGPAAVDPGPTGDRLRLAIHRFATAADLPIVADVLSGVRGVDSDTLVDLGPHVLQNGAIKADLVLRIGDTPTAKAVRLWWEKQPGPHVLLDPLRRWHDPSHMATSIFVDPIEALLTSATTALSTEIIAFEQGSKWLAEMVAAGATARAAADSLLDQSADWTEAHVARSVAKAAAASGQLVFTSSSMPVRDLDTFASTSLWLVALANRGINGIDGVVASAIGAARARPGSPVIVHIGDVALLHDIGSVLDAVRQEVSLTIVVPNNDGGGIFSFLPTKQVLHESTFDALFHTPHGTNFSALAGFEGISHQMVTAATIDGELASAATSGGVQIIEARVDTSAHVRLHEDLNGRVATAISPSAR